MHYLLVEDGDVALFRDLEGPRRRVIPESALLPPWLKPRPDPLSFGKRRVWTGFRALLRGVRPLRGWHAQQLRKFALATISAEDVVLFADSDMLFLRPFDLASLTEGDAVRLYRKPDGITDDDGRACRLVRERGRPARAGAAGTAEPRLHQQSGELAARQRAGAAGPYRAAERARLGQRDRPGAPLLRIHDLRLFR